MITAVYCTRPTLACPYKIGLTLFLLSAVAAMGRIPHTSVAALCSPQPLASRTAPPQWKKLELILRAPKPRCAKGTDATLDRELHPFCALERHHVANRWPRDLAAPKLYVIVNTRSCAEEAMKADAGTPRRAGAA
jgi:hypothetical protein